MKSIKNILITLCAVSVMVIGASAYAAPTQAPTSKSTTTTTTATGVTKTKGSVSGSNEVTSGTVSGKSVSSSSSDSVRSDGSEDYTEENNTDENTGEVDVSAGEETGIEKPVPTAIAAAAEQTQTGVAEAAAQKAAEKKYTTKGGSFLWFVLSVLVNLVLSFLIGNRFYNLSKKEKNVGAEIKALRRDLEEKFVSNVGGFSEMETDVTNTNDNYSINGSISMPERHGADFAADSEDVFKRWDSRMNRIKSQEVIEEEPEEEEERPRRKYQPARKPAPEEEDDTDELDEFEETRRISTVKQKAKSFLGDIFPFKEEE
ncbi:MAG: hypothetical protein PUF72_02445 [Clostridiales bacterium]|nr:hypothetical protein [Clostridiales bacterium]